MQSMLEILEGEINNIKDTLKELLNHSSIKKMYLNVPGFSLPPGYHDWQPLNEESQQLQSKAKEVYNHYSEIINNLLRKQPKNNIKKIEQSEKDINSIIEQNKHTFLKNTQEALNKIKESFEIQKEVLYSLYSPDGKIPIYVPDTNALLKNPVIENWSFPDCQKFKILLTSTVLSELDKLKIEHRNEGVREKSEKIIKQIKEYRRRGKLHDGVTIKKDIIKLFTLPTEPSMKEIPDSLDEHNNDDRIIATMLEIVRKYPRSYVILVTRDINLQNKADYWLIPFCEPPENK
jgi:rRNA-processing protein FCF1